MTLKQAYDEIARFIEKHNIKIDSFEVVNEVDKYRNYWKPEKTNVILLAESHVFTSDDDFDKKIDYSRFKDLIPNYPDGYVRFVYCLGYSEYSLLKNLPHDKRVYKRGTPQYWEIFSACASKSEQFNFDGILKTKTRNDFYRIRDKIGLLRKLKEMGVWLVDSSIVGLYRSGEKKPSHKIMSEIILISWDNYIRDLVQNSKPKCIICVGKFVGKVLKNNLNQIKIPFFVQPQPQARLSAKEKYEVFKKYQKICSEYRPCTTAGDIKTLKSFSIK